MYPIMNTANSEEVIEKLPVEIEELIEKKYSKISGLVLVGFDTVVVNFNRYTPSTGSSYIDLPAEINNKKACLNINHEDNKCGKYCVQAVVYGITNEYNTERMYRYKNLDDTKINWGNITHPLKMCGFDRLEQNNAIPEEDELVFISLNVYVPYNLDGKIL